MNIKILCFSVLILCVFKIKAQIVLTPQKAISLALDYNYGIKVANKDIEVAENNASILNSGYLPSLSFNANSFVNVDNLEANFNNGDQRILKGAKSSSYSTSIDVNYVLFDGLSRLFNYKQLKNNKQLTELQARETIENVVFQLFTVYYNLAEIIDREKAFNETLAISKERLIRAGYQFEYGQNTKLQVLNAEVDINNDSISVTNAKQLVVNYKRDLNLVLGNSFKDDFDIDTSIKFDNIYDKKELSLKMKENNIVVLQMDKNIQITNLDLKSSKSAFLPTVGLVGSYGWNKNNNNSASFLSTSNNNGFTGGLTLSWNVFDGGKSVTQMKNSKIAIESQNLQKEELEITLERDFNNAWDDFQNKLHIYKLREKNINTAKDNFNRTKEKLKLGQVTSIEFRQAQLNLLNAELSKNQAKYQAKLAEIQMLQMSGEILNVNF